jgi:hypothetical protein
MINKGKQLDAVKFIQALNLVHEYPLLPILRSYMNAAKNAGSLIRIRGAGSSFPVQLCCSIICYEHNLLKFISTVVSFFCEISTGVS